MRRCGLHWMRYPPCPAYLRILDSTSFCTIRFPVAGWSLTLHSLAGSAPPQREQVRFVHVFLADWLTSLVKVDSSAAAALCFYASGHGFDQCPQAYGPPAGSTCEDSPVMKYAVLPALASLPLLLRLAQCLRMYGATRRRWPHLANGFKYCFSLCIVVLGSTHSEWSNVASLNDVVGYFWVGSYAISTLYTYFWDVVMDWGFQPHRAPAEGGGGGGGGGGWRLLREERLLTARRWAYLLAVVSDLFLRFAWTLSLWTPTFDAPHPSMFARCVALVAPFVMCATALHRMYAQAQCRPQLSRRSCRQVPRDLPAHAVVGDPHRERAAQQHARLPPRRRDPTAL